MSLALIPADFAFLSSWDLFIFFLETAIWENWLEHQICNSVALLCSLWDEVDVLRDRSPDKRKKKKINKIVLCCIRENKNKFVDEANTTLLKGWRRKWRWNDFLKIVQKICGSKWFSHHPWQLCSSTHTHIHPLVPQVNSQGVTCTSRQITSSTLASGKKNKIGLVSCLRTDPGPGSTQRPSYSRSVRATASSKARSRWAAGSGEGLWPWSWMTENLHRHPPPQFPKPQLAVLRNCESKPHKAIKRTPTTHQTSALLLRSHGNLLGRSKNLWKQNHEHAGTLQPVSKNSNEALLHAPMMNYYSAGLKHFVSFRSQSFS